MKRISILLIGLAALLSACTDTSTVGGTGTGSAGIQGQVLLGPMCPVEQEGSPCPDKPIEAEITVADEEGKTVATGRSEADGTYRIPLPPGSYTVVAKQSDGPLGLGEPIAVEVPAGVFVHVNLLVDSGIR